MSCQKSTCCRTKPSTNCCLPCRPPHPLPVHPTAHVGSGAYMGQRATFASDDHSLGTASTPPERTRSRSNAPSGEVGRMGVALI